MNRGGEKGGSALTGDFLDHTLEAELSLLHVNCRAPFVLAHTIGRKLGNFCHLRFI